MSESGEDLRPRGDYRLASGDIIVIIGTLDSLFADSVINVALDKRVSFYVIHLPLFEPRDGRLEVRRRRDPPAGAPAANPAAK